MNNHRLFKITAIAATDTKPARVKIADDRFRKTVILSFSNCPSSVNPLLETAKNYLETKKIVCSGFGELFQGDCSAGFIIFSADFDTNLK